MAGLIIHALIEQLGCTQSRIKVQTWFESETAEREENKRLTDRGSI